MTVKGLHCQHFRNEKKRRLMQSFLEQINVGLFGNPCWRSIAAGMHHWEKQPSGIHVSEWGLIWARSGLGSVSLRHMMLKNPVHWSALCHNNTHAALWSCSAFNEPIIRQDEQRKWRGGKEIQDKNPCLAENKEKNCCLFPFPHQPTAHLKLSTIYTFYFTKIQLW